RLAAIVRYIRAISAGTDHISPVCLALVRLHAVSDAHVDEPSVHKKLDYYGTDISAGVLQLPFEGIEQFAGYTNFLFVQCGLQTFNRNPSPFVYYPLRNYRCYICICHIYAFALSSIRIFSAL